MLDNLPVLSDLKLFTFVRDPYQRFIAGLVESIHRTLNPIYSPNNPASFLLRLGLKGVDAAKVDSLKDNSTGLLALDAFVVQQMLTKVLSLERAMVLPGHFFPMAGTLFNYNISLVGHLDTFAADWERIMSEVHGSVPKYNYNLGLHPTSMSFPTVAAPPKSMPLSLLLFHKICRYLLLLNDSSEKSFK